MADGAEACPTCGMDAAVEAPLQPVAAAPAPAVFEPGPSFNEPPSAAADGPELPGWLQSFGGAVEEPPSQAMSFPVEHVLEEPEHIPAGLPNWLAAPRAERSASTAPAWNLSDGKFGDHEENGFISEDDLPDWLRSIGGEDSPDDAPTAGQVRGPASATTRELRIPTVVNAWVVGRETVAPAPGESLFAHIASEEQPEAGSAERMDMEQTSSPALAEALTDAPVQELSLALDTHAAARSRRMLIYVAIAMLLLLLLIMIVQR